VKEKEKGSVPFNRPADRLTRVTDWANRVTEYTYDENGGLIKVLRPNGTEFTRTYDDAGQLLQQQDSFGDNIITQFYFASDAAGNIVRS